MALVTTFFIFVILGFYFEKGYIPSNKKSIAVAYILWIVGVFGLLGLHRLYLGKYGTGLLWMFTAGVLGVGAIIDLYTLSRKVEEHNLLVDLRSVFLANQYDNTLESEEKPIKTLPLKIIDKDNHNKKEIKNDLKSNTLNKMDESSAISNINEKNFDDSIIDITDQPIEIIPNSLIKHNSSVPFWEHRYITSYSAINNASAEQKEFYNIFKNNFLKSSFIDLEGNLNYVFILLFDLLIEYDSHKDIYKLEAHLKDLGEHYPKTKTYCFLFLIEKMELGGYNDDVARLRVEENLNNHYNKSNYYSNDFWGMGEKYKSILSLNEEEVKLLNKLWEPINNFCNIEFCLHEVIKLYLLLISELKAKYKALGSSIDDEFIFVADIIVRKHFNYKKSSQNYKYSIESTTNQFYSNILKKCENAVREYYGHKRKLNTDTYYTNEEAKLAYEFKINSNVSELLTNLISKVAKPNEETELELNSQTTSRWKIKFEEIKKEFKDNPNNFINSINELVRLNKKNPSNEKIYLEATKFIARYDNIATLILYVNYVHEYLKSPLFDENKLQKTIKKSVFTTNEQFSDFEKIVSELVNDKDIDKAHKAVQQIFEVKRRKIYLNKTDIIDVQQKHAGTVELLNEYLRDEHEEEINSIKSQNINNSELKLETIHKKEDSYPSSFLSELSLNPTQISFLEMFSKRNFSIPQIEIEELAKSQGVFKNQVIESINEACYEVLNDVLIEEDDDFFTIIPAYFHKIYTK